MRSCRSSKIKQPMHAQTHSYACSLTHTRWTRARKRYRRANIATEPKSKWKSSSTCGVQFSCVFFFQFSFLVSFYSSAAFFALLGALSRFYSLLWIVSNVFIYVNIHRNSCCISIQFLVVKFHNCFFALLFGSRVHSQFVWSSFLFNRPDIASLKSFWHRTWSRKFTAIGKAKLNKRRQKKRFARKTKKRNLLKFHARIFRLLAFSL